MYMYQQQHEVDPIGLHSNFYLKVKEHSSEKPYLIWAGERTLHTSACFLSNLILDMSASKAFSESHT